MIHYVPEYTSTLVAVSENLENYPSHSSFVTKLSLIVVSIELSDHWKNVPWSLFCDYNPFKFITSAVVPISVSITIKSWFSVTTISKYSAPFFCQQHRSQPLWFLGFTLVVLIFYITYNKKVIGTSLRGDSWARRTWNQHYITWKWNLTPFLQHLLHRALHNTSSSHYQQV